MIKSEPTDYFYHAQTEEYQACWRLHSDDGISPELDYNELICTIVDLYKKIAELEARLDKQEEYQQEQND
jgi:hypothetical protein